jgi:arylsulfatase A-like enzyme
MRAKISTWSRLAILAAVALVGCGGGPAVLPATRGYLLISIDTLRADHLGCYGYQRDTSPFIDSLAARGVLFENAFVQLPGTLPSHMSIFTGLYPAEHGVMPPAGVLSPDIETLPEAFQRSGYRTAGHTEGGYMHGGYGFARGFDEFSHEAKKIETDVERTVARGLDFLRRLDEDERFFLFLHSYVVHDPYFPPKEYRERFWPRPEPDTFPATGPNLVAVNRGERTLSPEGLEFFRASYDASIRYMDDVLRGFFAEVEQLGLLNETTVILTSDHGEEFLEHGELTHGQIYPETLRVPLVVLHPAIGSPRRVATVVQSIDLAPTLYAIAGVEPATHPSGRSLVGLLAGADEKESEAFATSFGERNRALIRRRGESLHQLVLSQAAAAGEAVWVSGAQVFDTFEGRLELEVKGFYTSDRLQVTVDGEPAAAVDLAPDEWTAVKLDLSGGAEKKRIRLTSSGCTVPRDVGLGEDRRCLSFMIRGVPLRLLELYDLAHDPLASDDVSVREEHLLRRMLPRLDDYDREPIATSEVQNMDPELEQRLRALGYLQ